MYYEFLVTHLDAPFLLLSAVTTGLIIRIFYKQYMSTNLSMRVVISVALFLINAIIIVPGIVFIYRWIMLCGFFNQVVFLKMGMAVAEMSLVYVFQGFFYFRKHFINLTIVYY